MRWDENAEIEDKVVEMTCLNLDEDGGVSISKGNVTYSLEGFPNFLWPCHVNPNRDAG